jgi:hypothetical protein
MPWVHFDNTLQLLLGADEFGGVLWWLVNAVHVAVEGP